VYAKRFSPQARQGMPVGDLKRAHYCGSYAIVAPRVWRHYFMRP